MLSLIIGILVTVASVYAGLKMRSDVATVLKGALPVMFLFGGLLAIIAGGTAIRDKSEARKQQKQDAEESK
jgi:formate-dependent nitrite reductase membrane component NrfD